MSALQEWVEHAATAIELLAVAIIVVTIAYSTAVYIGRLARGAADDITYKGYRHQLARALLATESGRAVRGTVAQGGGISWTIGRERGIEI